MAHLARSLDQVEADLRAQGAKTAQTLPQQTPVKTAVQAGGTTKIVPPQVKPQKPLTQVRAERSGEPESDPKAEPEEGEASEDSGSYSIGERDFLLNQPAFIHMQQLNEFKAMPDWKDFLKPLRVPDEMTVTGMVRAFAEDPSEDFFEKQHGARLTAFATTMHHSKFQAIKKAFADERKRTRGMWEDIVDVQNGLRNYQTNVNARLDNLQRELDALKLEPEQSPWVPVGTAPSPAADSAAAVETQAATQPPAAANAAPVDTQAAPPLR